MLKTRLEEELPILVLDTAQHCTWLQNLGVALKTELARYEDLWKWQNNFKWSCSGIALGPLASVLLDVCEEDECDPTGLSSPDTSEDEEEAREHST
ncbi:unnamed protein product [Arctogadus glacialis]